MGLIMFLKGKDSLVKKAELMVVLLGAGDAFHFVRHASLFACHLFSGSLPIVGMLMIPKALAYVWIVLMGWRLYRLSYMVKSLA